MKMDSCSSAQDGREDVESMAFGGGIKATKKKKKKKFRFIARDRLVTVRVHRSRWSRRGSSMIRSGLGARWAAVKRRWLDGLQWRAAKRARRAYSGHARDLVAARGVAAVIGTWIGKSKADLDSQGVKSSVFQGSRCSSECWLGIFYCLEYVLYIWARNQRWSRRSGTGESCDKIVVTRVHYAHWCIY